MSARSDIRPGGYLNHMHRVNKYRWAQAVFLEHAKKWVVEIFSLKYFLYTQ